MKSSFKRLWMSAVGVGALALSACSGPPSQADVQEKIPDRTVALLLAANASANKAGEGEAATTLLPSGEGSDTSTAALVVDDETASRELERLRIYLRDRVFTADHFEGTDGDMAVFLMTDTICTEGTLPKNPGCVAFLSEVDVRLGVSRQSGDRLAVDLMLGAERAAPIRYVVGEDSLAFQVALSQFHQTAEVLGLRGLALGAALPDVLEGRVQVGLERLGAEAFEATLSVLEAVRVEDTLAQGPVVFSTGVAEPLARVMVDGETRAVALGANVAETLLELPYRAMNPEGTAGETLTFDFAGLSFLVSGADGEPVTVTGAGLGNATSSVKLDGAPLVSLDINPEAGRTFAATLKLLEGGVQEIVMEPGFELFLQLALEPLTADQEIEPSFIDNSLHVVLAQDGGRIPRLLVHPADVVGEQPGYFELNPGNFVFALGSGERFEATTGDCFTFVDAPEAPEAGAVYLPIDFTTCR